MKLAELSRLLQGNSRFGTPNCFHKLYSSKAKPIIRYTRPWDELLHRICLVGSPEVSIVPVLDRWVQEGRHVDRYILEAIIKELRSYKRYSHALQVVTWITDNRFYDLTSADVAIQLELISKTQGIEQVEKYFNNTPLNLKDKKVYGSLLGCYATAKCVEKAEEVMQIMRSLIRLGFAQRPLLTYNNMLSLYSKTGNMGKFNALLQEMEENGIVHDKFTVAIQLRAYADVKDVKGIDNMVTLMESDPNILPDQTTYSVAANGYKTAGLMDKAFEMLKKSEAIATTEKRFREYNFLITQYASIGRKDEVIRLWSIYKEKEGVCNSGYYHIIESLVKLGDLEMAEICFEEWESLVRFYDVKIPNYLIGAYCGKGQFAKAEALIDRAIAKGGKPNAWTWYRFSVGYFENDQPQKAVEMMKRALVIHEPLWRPNNKYIAACLEYLKDDGDFEQAQELIESLLEKAIISSDMQAKLLSSIKVNKSVQKGALLELMEAEDKIKNKTI